MTLISYHIFTLNSYSPNGYFVSSIDPVSLVRDQGKISSEQFLGKPL